MTNKPEPNTRAGEVLKPCPFCNSPAYMQSGEGRDYDQFIIKCDGLSGSVRCPVYPTTGTLLPKAEAITAWNTRAQPELEWLGCNPVAPRPQPSELVDKLLEMGNHPCRAHLPMGATLREAAAQIAKLQAVGDKLAGALEPFSMVVDDLDERDRNTDHIWEHPAAMGITKGDLRRAAQALTEWKDRA